MQEFPVGFLNIYDNIIYIRWYFEWLEVKSESMFDLNIKLQVHSKLKV
jgi:hypothetical protein